MVTARDGEGVLCSGAGGSGAIPNSNTMVGKKKKKYYISVGEIPLLYLGDDFCVTRV